MKIKINKIVRRKQLLPILCVLTFASAIVAPIIAQQTREQAIGGMRKVEAKEIDPTYTTAAP
jgi:hypothetical protein